MLTDLQSMSELSTQFLFRPVFGSTRESISVLSQDKALKDTLSMLKEDMLGTKSVDRDLYTTSAHLGK